MIIQYIWLSMPDKRLLNSGQEKYIRGAESRNVTAKVLLYTFVVPCREATALCLLVPFALGLRKAGVGVGLLFARRTPRSRDTGR